MSESNYYREYFKRAKTPKEKSALLDELEEAYDDHSEDGALFGTSEPTQKTAIEAMRLNLYSQVGAPQLGLFEKKSKGHIVNADFEKHHETEKDEYEGKLERIRNLTVIERNSLKEKLYKYATESALKDLYCGGFAIDGKTLQYAATRGHGKHGLALVELQRKIHMSESEHVTGNVVLENPLRGMSYYDIDDFKYPIIFFHSGDINKHHREAIEYLKSLKKFIVIDQNCNLL